MAHMIDWISCSAVERDPQRISGVWVFRGTRVPVAALFDQGTPAPLRRHLPAHQVSTAFELQWQTLKNGELIERAETEGFEVLITTDQNLKYQQILRQPVAGSRLRISARTL